MEAAKDDTELKPCLLENFRVGFGGTRGLKMFQRTFVLTEEHFRPAQVVIRMSKPSFFFEGRFDQLFRTRPVASLNGQYSQFVAREYIERIDFELTLKRG